MQQRHWMTVLRDVEWAQCMLRIPIFRMTEWQCNMGMHLRCHSAQAHVANAHVADAHDQTMHSLLMWNVLLLLPC
jgi:hypothetical protein